MPLRQPITDPDNKRQAIRNAVIATIGNAIEWSDFTLFGLMAVTISKVFFPTFDNTAALLATLVTFGAGFLARPVGAVIFGRLGDIKGRKYVLVLSISIMSVASLTIGCAPTYAQAGVIGTTILVLARLLQGVSAGTEFGSAIAYLYEWAPSARRGLFGSFHQFGAGLGTLFGALVSALITSVLPTEKLLTWGWRIPFLIGGFMALIGIILRLRLPETPEFKNMRMAPRPVRGVLVPTLQVIGISALWTVSIFASVIYMPTFTAQYSGVTSAQALWASIIGMCLMLTVIPISGAASDRWGAKPILLTSSVVALCGAYPGYAALASGPTYSTVVMIVGLFAILAGVLSGVGPAAIAQLFDPTIRSKWTSIGSAISITIFGGFAPLISQALIKTMHWTPAPSLYLIAIALVTALTSATLSSDFYISPSGKAAASRF
jgi:MHS family proline/betaine transporter-like MFS transporter